MEPSASARHLGPAPWQPPLPAACLPILQQAAENRRAAFGLGRLGEGTRRKGEEERESEKRVKPKYPLFIVFPSVPLTNSYGVS